MVGGPNRRRFNTVEARRGGAIALLDDGTILVAPGTYRIDGFSLVTTSSLMVTPTGSTFGGYCVVCETRHEGKRQEMLANAIAIGSPSLGLYAVPSHFDGVRTFEEPVRISVLHQSGEELGDQLYLTYVDGDPSGPSATRVFARVSIFEL